MVKILNCYLYAKNSYGTLSKGAIFFGQPCICFFAKEHSLVNYVDVQLVNKEGACFEYIQEKFLYIIAKKVKKTVFVGPLIRNSPKTLNFYLPCRMWKKSMAFHCRSK